MRLLVLVLNILVGFSLLTHSAENLATSISNESSRSFTRSHEKHKRSRLHRKNRVHEIGNVWERIRLGMQLPRPVPVPISMLTEQIVALTSTGDKIETTPFNDVAKLSNYHKTANDSPKSAVHEVLPTKTKLDNVSNSQSAQPRVHTRLDLGFLEPQSSEKIETSSIVMIGNSNQNAFPANTLTELDSKILEQQRQLQIKQQEELAKQREIQRQQLIKQVIIYERVNKQIINYTRHRDYLYQIAERAKPYLYHIVDKLQQHKLPFDLALLPIVESAYQPTAQSPKSAAGLWQFIPSTAQDFNLQQSEHYDERLDITASTQAAIRYLAFLNRHFKGDWLLALAAYNCGLGAVDSAIRTNIAQGRDTDYWSLNLPAETQDYVPRLLALTNIFADPARYQLKLKPIRNEPYFITVKIQSEFDVKYLTEKNFAEIAQLADMSHEQFTLLNPGYLHPTLIGRGPFTFLLPTANANLLTQRLAVIAKFMEEPLPAAAPFKSEPETLSETRKLPFYNAITNPPIASKLSIPFISLNISSNQHRTTPRMIVLFNSMA